jgi:hypothetical protein
MQPSLEIIETNGIRLRVALAGKGPFIVLVPVLRIASVDLIEIMRNQVSDLRLVRLIENAGHRVQQERPAEVNATLL